MRDKGAVMFSNGLVMTNDRLRKQIKAGFPFNPISGNDIYGMNLFRLQQAMETFNWVDPRFVSAEEAELNGWRVKHDSQSVTINVRDKEYGTIDSVVLYNASNVIDMPSIQAMAEMTNDELTILQDNGRAFDIKEEFGEDLIIAPARDLKLANEADLPQQPQSNSVKTKKIAEPNLQYTVIANYWHGGLHNVRGIALAQRINEEIARNDLEENPKAIQTLIDKNPEAKRYGLKLVTEEEYKKNIDYIANAAEPKELLGGAYVRDRNSAYRPKGGGTAVLQDNGESLQIKSKSKDSYRAAIDLAMAKGWTAIELKGKKSAMPDLWLEAKLKGIDVVNYKPTEKDIKKFEARLELMTGELADDLKRRKLVEDSKSQEAKTNEPVETIKEESKEAAVQPLNETPLVEQPPVQSVTHALTSAEGVTESITVTYEVRFSISGSEVNKFKTPEEAAKDFVRQPGFGMPSVVKVTARGNDIIGESMIAVTSEQGGAIKKQIATNALDSAFNKAFDAELVNQQFKPKIDHKDTMFSGVIIDIDKERNLVKQKTGRLHSDVVYHSMSNLGFIPEKDKSLVIEYDRSGKANLQKNRALEKSGMER
jgi:hypothetical protein